jgi:hypothetical protein
MSLQRLRFAEELCQDDRGGDLEHRWQALYWGLELSQDCATKHSLPRMRQLLRGKDWRMVISHTAWVFIGQRRISSADLTTCLFAHPTRCTAGEALIVHGSTKSSSAGRGLHEWILCDPSLSGAACTSINPIYNLAHGHLSITIIDIIGGLNGGKWLPSQEI